VGASPTACTILRLENWIQKTLIRFSPLVRFQPLHPFIAGYSSVELVCLISIFRVVRFYYPKPFRIIDVIVASYASNVGESGQNRHDAPIYRGIGVCRYTRVFQT
jgi:hypothetical protein